MAQDWFLFKATLLVAEKFLEIKSLEKLYWYQGPRKALDFRKLILIPMMMPFTGTYISN
jgi:hypothetical protein